VPAEATDADADRGARNGRRRTTHASRWQWGLALFAITAMVGLSQIGEALPRAVFGDEWRYLLYANNLLEGHYSPRERVFLCNGPGYPLLLVPFVGHDWQDGARLLNAFLHAGAVLYAWLFVYPALPVRAALGVVAALIAYPALREHLPLLYTEAFTTFLSVAWVYHAWNAMRDRRHLAVAGVLLGILCLTRVNFGPATMCLGIVTGAFWLIRRDDLARSYCIQAGIALLLCVPYLAYTYSLTGRWLYWSSAGGNMFYWLTSPFPEEYGDWYHQGWVYNNELLRAHHKLIHDRTTGLGASPGLPILDQLFNITSPEAGDEFMEHGLRNVREHPLKFFLNWCANVSRLFFDVPVSVRGTPFWNVYTKSHIWLLPAAALLFWKAWRARVPFPRRAWPLVAFTILSFGIYSFVSSTARYLIPIAAIWLLLGAFWAGEIIASKARPRGRRRTRASNRITNQSRA
jgi:hypothetical protein